MRKFWGIIAKTWSGKLGLLFLFGFVILLVDYLGKNEGGLTIEYVFEMLGISLLFFGIGYLKYSKNETTYKAQDAFKATKKIGSYVSVDDANKKFCIPVASKIVYDFKDLIDFEIAEDGNTISSNNAAKAGYLLFGLGGAIAGSVLGSKKVTNTCRSLKIVVHVNDLKKPVLEIPLVKSEIKKDTSEFKKAAAKAEEITGVLQYIKSNS